MVTSRWPHFRLAKGDLLISTSASLGRVSEVTSEAEGAIAYTGIIRFRPRDCRVLREYLRVYLESAEFAEQAEAMAAGSVIRHFGPSHLREMWMSVPPKKTQGAIGEMALALDDKVELNRRMAETLEFIAQALFENWLRSVPIEPKIKAQALIERGVLAIGDGYRAKNSELYPPGLPFLRAANLANGFNLDDADTICEESVGKAGSKIARSGDIAFTSKGTIGRFARVHERTPVFVYSPQVCFWRSTDHKKLHPAVLYCWMRTGDFQNQLLAAAGQTDMAPYISLRDQREIYLPLFPINQAAIGETLTMILTKKQC